MRKPFIAANWKMNKTMKEASIFMNEFRPLVKHREDIDIVVCAPFTLLYGLEGEMKGTNIHLGAQNIYSEESGAFTGEISAAMIREFAEYTIIGHSERRELFHETNKMVNKKIKKALEHDLKVIFCIGEILAEKESGITKRVIESQLREGLADIKDISRLIIAYEPVWAISKGDPDKPSATPRDAQFVHSFIRELLRILYMSDAADSMRIIYGGSMKPSNVNDLMAMPDIDGGLVGSASLDAKSFAEIVNFRRQ